MFLIMVVVFFLGLVQKYDAMRGRAKSVYILYTFFSCETSNYFRALLILRGCDFLSFMFQNVFITAWLSKHSVGETWNQMLQVWFHPFSAYFFHCVLQLLAARNEISCTVFWLFVDGVCKSETLKARMKHARRMFHSLKAVVIKRLWIEMKRWNKNGLNFNVC